MGERNGEGDGDSVWESGKSLRISSMCFRPKKVLDYYEKSLSVIAKSPEEDPNKVKGLSSEKAEDVKGPAQDDEVIEKSRRVAVSKRRHRKRETKKQRYVPVHDLL